MGMVTTQDEGVVGDGEGNGEEGAREKVCVVVEVDDLDDGFELVLVEKGGAAEDDVELWEEEGDDPKHDGDKGDDVAEEKGGKRDDEVLLHLVVHGRGRAE